MCILLGWIDILPIFILLSHEHGMEKASFFPDLHFRKLRISLDVVIVDKVNFLFVYLFVCVNSITVVY